MKERKLSFLHELFWKGKAPSRVMLAKTINKRDGSSLFIYDAINNNNWHIIYLVDKLDSRFLCTNTKKHSLSL